MSPATRFSRSQTDSPLTRIWRRLGRHAGIARNAATALLCPRPPGTINALEIVFVGCPRSGNHAVINWLRRQASGLHLHLNDCTAEKNPFDVNFGVTWGRKTAWFDHYQLPLWDDTFRHRLRRELLIRSYEDCALERILCHSVEEHHDAWLGQSERRVLIILLRDPYNFLASNFRRFQHQPAQEITRKLARLRSIWLGHAEHFRKTQKDSDPNTLGILFNRWVWDQPYRQSIAAALELQFSDRGKANVARFGPTVEGKSFDGLAFEGRPEEMALDKRWQEYADNELYQHACQHAELRTQAAEWFDESPELAAWLDNLLAARS